MTDKLERDRRAPNQSTSSRTWVALTAAASILACVMLAFLHFQQRQVLRAAQNRLASVRQARVDLSKGFLYLSLGGAPDFPFDSAQGLALLDQAIQTFDRDVDLLEGRDRALRSEAFHRSAERFQNRLVAWRDGGERSPADAAALRIAFSDLERQGAALDSLHAQRVLDLANRLDARFSMVLGGVLLLLLLLSGTILVVVRAKTMADRESRESDDLFRTIFNQTPTGFALTSTDSRLLLVNDGFADMLGYTPKELAGRTLASITHPDDLESGNLTIQNGLADGPGTLTFEKRYLHRNGHIVWASGRSVLRRDSEGKPIHFITNAQDITARKQMEETLRESESRLRYALEGANEGFWDIRLDMDEAFLSPRTMELLGYEAGVPELHHGSWMERLHPEDVQRVETSLVRHLAGELPLLDLEARLKTESGSWLWAQIRGKVVVRDGTGRPLRMTGTFTDLTVQKRLEQQLLQSQKLEAIGQLAGGIAHDFNNILMGIMGFAETSLLRLQPDDPVAKNLRQIREVVERSARMTHQLLGFARQQAISPRTLDLNQVVEGMIRLLHRLIGEQIGLSWSPAKDLSPVHIDPAQIDQILANLCVNARDAISGAGQIRIETQLVRPVPEELPADIPALPEWVVLSVSDTGCGMDAETLRRIFEPFFTTKAPGQGTGLGLANVYGIVRQNQGFVRVSSELGRGTTFRIYLPAQKRAQIDRMASAPVATPRGRGEAVLLAEDDASIREATQLMLQDLGYNVLVSQTPQEAVRLAESQLDSLRMILTDVVMPGMNGPELVARLRQLRPGLPCIYMSGYAPRFIRDMIKEDSANFFIQKPFNLHDLAVRIREHLDGVPQSPDLTSGAAGP